MVSFSEPSMRFNHGDEVVVDFCARDVDGGVVDLTGIVVTAEVWTRDGKVYAFSTAPGEGIEITNPNPPAATNPEDQEPQGAVRLSEEQAAFLPFGRLSWLKMIFVDEDGLTDSSQPVWFNKVLP